MTMAWTRNMMAAAIGLAMLTVSPRPPAAERPRRVLTVCADPNNLPFSNRAGEGFENQLAELVARELGAELAYEWRAQRRGFVREGLKAGVCDLIMAMPAGAELARTTRPYYRSTYVLVTRRADRHRYGSLDAPALRTARIGVQIIGDDYTNSPPVHALVARGLIDNLVGYTVYGDYAVDSPPAEVVRAVARGEVDVAVAWGPMAGYFAQRSEVPLAIVPVADPPDAPPDRVGDPAAHPPMRFAIAMAVRHDDDALAAAIDRVLVKRRARIDAILRRYGVPRA